VSRTSNFMLWQKPPTPSLFHRYLWPDFNTRSLDQTLAWLCPAVTTALVSADANLRRRQMLPSASQSHQWPQAKVSPSRPVTSGRGKLFTSILRCFVTMNAYPGFWVVTASLSLTLTLRH
jgi:hypothetical protein